MTSTRGAATGDRSDRWVRSYRAVRKDALQSTATTNRRRLARLGAPALARSGGLWLDVGAGDGNLMGALAEAGAGAVVGVEPQAALLAAHTTPSLPVAGSATALPVRTGSVAVAVAMDVLHHLTPDELPGALAEARRALAPGGHLLVCEPADTPVRRLLDRLLRGPLGGATAFTRHKRAMVEEEAATLYPWLAAEHGFVRRAEQLGFVVEARHRGPLHACTRLRRT